MNEKQIEREVYNFLNGISENSKIYFVGNTLKNPLEYKANEEIVFKVRAKTEEKFVDVPFIKCIVEGDSLPRSESILSANEDGWFYVSTSLNREGVIHVIAQALDENKEPIARIDNFEGGAIVDADKIELSTEIPDDYFEFWDWLKKETESVAPEVIYEREIHVPEHPDFEFRDMRIKVTDEEYASCMVSWPKNATEGSLKLRVYYRGYGVSPITEVDAYENTMTVITSPHSIPNDMPPEWYQNERTTTFLRFGFKEEENDDPKTTYWAKMLRRDYQSYRYFSQHPFVSGKDIYIEGGSMGAMQTCCIAAHCANPTRVHISFPWMCDLGGGTNAGRLEGWRPKYLHGMKYFDTAVAAKFIKCPLTVAAGLGDFVCPPSGQVALYKSAKTLERMKFIQRRTHSYQPPEAEVFELKL